MSERQKLIHLHSAEVKVPSKEILEYGEIAVQYNSGSAVLYTKKSDDVITKFVDETSVDNKIKVEQLRAEGIENSILEKIESLSGTNHTHANKELLDTYTQTEENLADAVAKNMLMKMLKFSMVLMLKKLLLGMLLNKTLKIMLMV